MSDLYYQFGSDDADIAAKVAHLRERADTLGSPGRLGGGYLALDGVVAELARLYSSFAGAVALIEQMIPLKKGDRVRLTKTPKCEGGWACSKHFLVAGAVGTIKSVQLHYLMRDWSVYVEFDDESYLDRGRIVPIDPEYRHVYGFAPHWVEKVPPPVERSYLETSG